MSMSRDRGLPYQSRDTGHVNPNPRLEDLWPFRPGQVRTIGYEPFVTFEVRDIELTSVGGVVVVGENRQEGELWLDMPVVVCRNGTTGEAMVTLTLRKIITGVAMVQVTANPRIKIELRQ